MKYTIIGRFEKYIDSETKMFKILLRLVFLEVLDAKRSWK